MTAPDRHHTSRQQVEDGSWFTSTMPAIFPGNVERRMFQIDNALTDVATVKTAVATAELRTYTFDVAEDYRHMDLLFIPDTTGVVSDVICLAWTLNAPNVTTAAARLSITETDADSVAEYLSRGEVATAGTNEPITRIDMTGILGQGGAALAQDLILLRVW